MLRTPLLAEFLRIVRDDVWARSVVERLVAVAGEVTPEFWSFEVSHDATPGLCDLMGGAGRPITIADLRRSSVVRTNEGGVCSPFGPPRTSHGTTR